MLDSRSSTCSACAGARWCAAATSRRSSPTRSPITSPRRPTAASRAATRPPRPAAPRRAPSAASSAPRTRAATPAARARREHRQGSALRRALAAPPAGLRRAAVLTLALGIGATTAVFALVDGILVTRLPYPAAGAPGHRQRDLSGRRAGRGAARADDDGRRRLRRRPRFTLAGDGPAMRVSGARCRPSCSASSASTPALGRASAPARIGPARPGRAPEPRAVALALRRRSPRRRPLDRRRRPGARSRRRAAGRRSICRRGGRSSGCRSRSIRATRRATGPATSCRSSGACAPARRRPQAQAELRLFQRDVRQQFPWTHARRLEPRLRRRAAADALVGGRRAAPAASSRRRCWSSWSSPAPTSPT